MPRPRFRPAALAAVLLPFAAGPATAAPLDLIPKQATLLVAFEKPRAIAEVVREVTAYQNAGAAIPSVREFFDSTPMRRFYRLVAFAEKETGSAWPDLLDRAAGHGIAVGAATGTDPAPALLVARGTDEKASADVFALFVRVVEEEAARTATSEAKGKLRRDRYHGTETVSNGDDFHAARVGPNILVANTLEALTAGLDLALRRKTGDSLADRPDPAAAKTLLGGDPLAWLWFDLGPAKKTKASMDFFANARKDLFQTLVAGGTIDAVRRADFVASGLFRTPTGFASVTRLPAKRADLPADFTLHVPAPGTPGSLPPLEPPGVVYSQSFYLDIAALWKNRKTLVNEQQLKDIEKAERDVSKVLPGTTLGKLFEQSGPYHRLVATSRKEKLYSVEPAQPIPPFAVVSTFRDPAFGRSATAALRAAGFLGSVQAGLTMGEAKVGDVTVVSYRFPENKPYPGGDPENVRFNFAPSFAVVGDSLIVGSTPGIVADLIPELKKPIDTALSSAAVWRGRAYASGVADLIAAYPDQTVTTTVLTDGVGLDQARKQVADFVKWLRTLGEYELIVDHTAEAFEVRVEWRTQPTNPGSHR